MEECVVPGAIGAPRGGEVAHRLRGEERSEHRADPLHRHRDAGLARAPLGPVYQAGTLSGNPVATACGLATLREVQKPGFYEALARSTRALVDGLLAAAREAGVPMSGDSEGGMFGFFFPKPEQRLEGGLPQNYAEVMATDGLRFNRFFHGMLERGVYLAPALYEAGFVSAAHGPADIEATRAAARAALAAG